MMYSLLQALFFRLPPETAHTLALRAARIAERAGLLSTVLAPMPETSPRTVMGLEFPNAVGLAAGLDKDAEAVDALGQMGFGFIEVGTVTPRAQPGNPRPRLFRLREYEAIINRMGFNNQGLAAMASNLRRTRYDGILGINVGKNLDTPVEKAADDYLLGMERVWELADYITVNVSSPNTPGLRDLQHGDALKRLLEAVSGKQDALHRERGHYVPVAVKVAPDMDEAAITFIAQALLDAGLDAVIATNTTLDHSAVLRHPQGEEAGGLSGRPLAKRSTQVIGALAGELNGKLPIIGVGGITDGESAAEKIRAGASLVQLYSGLIYRGPSLVPEVAAAVDRALAETERAR